MKKSLTNVTGLATALAFLSFNPASKSAEESENFFEDNEPSSENPFGQSNPFAPKGTSEYAFMIGAWNCDERQFKKGTWVSFKSLVKGKYFLNGYGIINTTYTRETVSLMTYEYKPETKIWTITNSNAPDYRHSIWEGGKGGEKMIARSKGVSPTGQPVNLQITFFEMQANSFQWKLEVLTGDRPFLLREKTCKRIK